ncbi:MAG: hypothetical protein ABI760_19990 [Ferruginibacter sp.]
MKSLLFNEVYTTFVAIAGQEELEIHLVRELSLFFQQNIIRICG